MNKPCVTISNGLIQDVMIIGRRLTIKGWQYDLSASAGGKKDFTKQWYQIKWVSTNSPESDIS